MRPQRGKVAAGDERSRLSRSRLPMVAALTAVDMTTGLGSGGSQKHPARAWIGPCRGPLRFGNGDLAVLLPATAIGACSDRGRPGSLAAVLFPPISDHILKNANQRSGSGTDRHVVN